MNAPVATLEPALVWRVVLVFAALLVATGGLPVALELRTDPIDAGGDTQIEKQDPAARSEVRRGSIVLVTIEPAGEAAAA